MGTAGNASRTFSQTTRRSKVSVVLATFNGEQFLEEQLLSLSAQTQLPDELVVVDDASADRTVEIVRSFERHAPFPVALTVQSSHHGTCETFAEGFRSANGDILAICDQDDRWLPEKLSIMTERMDAQPAALLAFSDAILVNASGARLSRSRWRVAGFGPRQWTAMERDPFGQMMMRQVVSGCTAAIRRELLPALLPFPSGLHPAMPAMMYDRWISLLAAACGRMLVVPERLVEYRIHPRQQIGIPALPIRRAFPHAALNLGQFVAPRVEKAGRFGFQRAHLDEITKRLAVSGLDSPSSELVLRLAQQYLETREHLNNGALPRRHVVRQYLDEDSYRRFSLGLSSALSDLTR